MPRRYDNRNAMPLLIRPSPADYRRFFAKVKMGDKGCWVWIGYTNPKGYGQFWFRGRMWWAHRWAKQALRGRLSYGKEADHKCYNPACCNPDHLRGRTKSQNSYNRRSFRKLPPKPDDGIPF